MQNDPVLKEIFLKKLNLFSSTPYHPSLKTNKLTGELSDLHSFRLGYDVRVVFSFASKSENHF